MDQVALWDIYIPAVLEVDIFKGLRVGISLQLFCPFFSHNSAVGLDMATSACWSTSLVLTEISQQWIGMKFGTHIHCPQRMNNTVVGDCPTFDLTPPAGQSFHLFFDLSRHRIEGHQ